MSILPGRFHPYHSNFSVPLTIALRARSIRCIPFEFSAMLSIDRCSTVRIVHQSDPMPPVRKYHCYNDPTWVRSPLRSSSEARIFSREKNWFPARGFELRNLRTTYNPTVRTIRSTLPCFKRYISFLRCTLCNVLIADENIPYGIVP